MWTTIFQVCYVTIAENSWHSFIKTNIAIAVIGYHLWFHNFLMPALSAYRNWFLKLQYYIRVYYTYIYTYVISFCTVTDICTHMVCTYIVNVRLSTTDEEVVTAWNNPTQSDQSWQATVQMAWQISPNLAFQLSMRWDLVFCKNNLCSPNVRAQSH